MTNTYRIRGWYRWLSVLVALITLTMIAGPVLFGLLGGGVYAYIFSQQDFQPESFFSILNNFIPFVMLCGIPALVVVFLAVIGVILPLGNSLFSYLRLGPGGLELRSWPGYRLRCRWDQVTGIERIRIVGKYSLPMLLFRQSQDESKTGLISQPGPVYVPMYSEGFNRYLPLLVPLFLLVFLWPRKEWNMVPVYLFKGWPDGKLRQELERRLGHLNLD
jgi:hypothetical protein